MNEPDLFSCSYDVEISTTSIKIVYFGYYRAAIYWLPLGEICIGYHWNVYLSRVNLIFNLVH